MNKTGVATSESLLMLYRVFLVSLVAFSVFFVVALYYDFYADTSNSEAVVLNRNIVNCLVSSGLDHQGLNEFRYQLLDYCNIQDGGEDRLYVRVNVSGSIYSGGDSGVRAIREMFELGSAPSRAYRPGFYSNNYSVYSYAENEIVNVEVSTYVKSEEK